MAIERSRIGWTDFSGGDLNFVLRGSAAGDCEVSPGCANCYAGAILRRNGRTSAATTWSEKKLGRLLKWEPEWFAPLRREGEKPLAFVCDMGDLFHESVPSGFIFDAIIGMAGRTDVDWQILTKRPRRMANLLTKLFTPPPPNIWLGVTAEDQERANERIPWLLRTPAAVRFVSCEPLLEPVDLQALNCHSWLTDALLGSDYSIRDDGQRANWRTQAETLDWVIVGGESGPRRRAFDVDWARALRDQCLEANVAFFYKQGSALRPGEDDVLDGRTWKQFPW